TFSALGPYAATQIGSRLSGFHGKRRVLPLYSTVPPLARPQTPPPQALRPPRRPALPFIGRTPDPPRPLPPPVRFPDISFSVANSEAVTVQSRVAGFVTIGPTVNLCVASRILEKITNGSSHSRWESNVHTFEKPYVSALRANSITRAAGGLVWR